MQIFIYLPIYLIISGVFEFDAFAKGTFGIASTLAELTGKGCITIIGGGGNFASIEWFRKYASIEWFSKYASIEWFSKYASIDYKIYFIN